MYVRQKNSLALLDIPSEMGFTILRYTFTLASHALFRVFVYIHVAFDRRPKEIVKKRSKNSETPLTSHVVDNS